MEELKEDEETFLGEPYRYDHLFAMYLLAQFRVKELYPLLVEILLKTGNLADEILGDTIAEGLGQILASVYNGDPEPLMRLIESPQANEYARGQALKALVALVFDRQLTREFAMDYMKQLLNGRLSEGSAIRAFLILPLNYFQLPFKLLAHSLTLRVLSSSDKSSTLVMMLHLTPKGSQILPNRSPETKLVTASLTRAPLATAFSNT